MGEGGEGGEGGAGPTPEQARADLQARVTRLEQQLTPLTPLYSLDQAATLLPARFDSLRVMLSRYRQDLDPPMYRRGPPTRPFRMLSHPDLLSLRSRLIRRPGAKTRAQAMKDLAALAKISGLNATNVEVMAKNWGR